MTTPETEAEILKVVVRHMAAMDGLFVGETGEEMAEGNPFDARAVRKYHTDTLFQARVDGCVYELLRLFEKGRR